jgi:hypothetical protein
MKYALIRQDGVVELREDSYELPINAIELTDEQYESLLASDSIISNGVVVANPNPIKLF